jgi:hypothetical protein
LRLGLGSSGGERALRGRSWSGSLLLRGRITEDSGDFLAVDEERATGAGVHAEDFTSRGGVGFADLQPTLVAGLNLKLSTFGFAINRSAVEEGEMDFSFVVSQDNGLLGVGGAIVPLAILEIEYDLDGSGECWNRLAGSSLNHL